MNLQHIFSEIEKTDPEIFERMDTRRNIMHRFKNIGSKLTLTAIPVALGSMLNKTYGQPPSQDIIDSLNFLLRIEYFECEFYTQGFANNVIDPSETVFFDLIKQHETAHIEVLKGLIQGFGVIPDPKPDQFDFRPNHTDYRDPFKSFDDFLAVAQPFEDLGIRAYKGQVSGLMPWNDVLTTILQIHSVEARHAAHIRRLRRLRDTAPKEKPWITGVSTNGIPEKWVKDVYDNEDTGQQLSVILVNLKNVQPIPASECFDEALSMTKVNEIIDPFMP